MKDTEVDMSVIHCGLGCELSYMQIQCVSEIQPKYMYAIIPRNCDSVSSES